MAQRAEPAQHGRDERAHQRAVALGERGKPGCASAPSSSLVERAAAAQHAVEDVGGDAAGGEAGNFGGRNASGRASYQVSTPSARAPITRIVTEPEREGSTSQRSPPIRRGCGHTLSRFSALREGNGAPGGARALRYGALARPLRSAACTRRRGAGCESHPEARASCNTGLRGPYPAAAPPGAPPRAAIVGGPHLARPRAPLEAPFAEQAAEQDKCGFDSGDNLFLAS